MPKRTKFYKLVTSGRTSPVPLTARVWSVRTGSGNYEYTFEQRHKEHLRHKHLSEHLQYPIGAIVRAHEFDKNPWKDCTAGIHGYVSRELAVEMLHSEYGDIIIEVEAKTVVRCPNGFIRAPAVRVLT